LCYSLFRFWLYKKLGPFHNRHLLQYTPHLHHYITRFYSSWVVIGEHGLKWLGKVASPHPLEMPTCGSMGGVEYSVALVVIRYLDSDLYHTCRISPHYSPYVWHVHYKNSALQHNKIDSKKKKKNVWWELPVLSYRCRGQLGTWLTQRFGIVGKLVTWLGWTPSNHDRLWHSYVSFSFVGSQRFVTSCQNLQGPRAHHLFVVLCWLPCCWALQFSSDNISSFRLFTACKISSSGCLFRVLEHCLTGSGQMLSWLSRMSTYDTSER